MLRFSAVSGSSLGSQTYWWDFHSFPYYFQANKIICVRSWQLPSRSFKTHQSAYHSNLGTVISSLNKPRINLWFTLIFLFSSSFLIFLFLLLLLSHVFVCPHWYFLCSLCSFLILFLLTPLPFLFSLSLFPPFPSAPSPTHFRLFVFKEITYCCNVKRDTFP